MPGAPVVRWVCAAAILASAAAGASPAGAAERRIHVQGRVTDPEGRGLPGQPVRLFKTRRGIELPRFTSGGQVAEAARVATDAGGFYEIDVPRDRSFDDFYLRFHDPASFDRVQFLVPADREITHDLKRGGAIQVDVVLARRPDWPEVARRIEAAGADSPKGRILRSLGLPEREGPGTGPDGPREEWWYHSQGVVYFFRDGRAAGFRRFEPVPPGPGEAPRIQAAGAGGGG
jgi:hypothetical protein